MLPSFADALAEKPLLQCSGTHEKDMPLLLLMSVGVLGTQDCT